MSIGLRPYLCSAHASGVLLAGSDADAVPLSVLPIDVRSKDFDGGRVRGAVQVVEANVEAELGALTLSMFILLRETLRGSSVLSPVVRLCPGLALSLRFRREHCRARNMFASTDSQRGDMRVHIHAHCWKSELQP